MRLLVVSQYFWPESFIINDIARTLDEQGHEVVVATGKPNYPDGAIFEGYRAAGTQRQRYLERVDVVRVPLWPRGRGGAKNLILNYLSFVVSGLVCLPWLLRGRQFDAIVVFAPSPITQAIPAILLKWLKRAKLALWVQDLWPESLAATGFIRNRHILRAVGWGVRGIYHCCDLLLVQSRAFVQAVARYADLRKIIYYPNSMRLLPADASMGLPDDLCALLEQHFCVVFAGNLGTAQALETLVEASKVLREDADIRLVLVGSGSRLAWLQEQQATHALSNLVLPGRFPAEAMPALFQRAAALLVSLSAEDIFAQTVPSKVQAYLAAGRPILGSLDGEGAQVIVEAGAGLVSPAGQVQGLVENVRRLKTMQPAARAAMGKSAEAYFQRHFEMGRQVAVLVELLKQGEQT